MSSPIQPSQPHRGGSGPRGKAAKRKAWNSRKDKRPQRVEAKGDELTKPKAKRRPEWKSARKAGAERQAEALIGLEAARAAAALRGFELSIAMFSPSRRSKPTIAHIRFLRDARVFAHYYPAVGRLFFGRKAKIADEGRYETVEEATARVIAYDDENRAEGDEFRQSP